jgi:hypothetical protein
LEHGEEAEGSEWSGGRKRVGVEAGKKKASAEPQSVVGCEIGCLKDGEELRD